MPTTSPIQKEFEKVPEGTHLARCFSFVHIGTIGGEWQGVPREFNKVRLSFELPDEMRDFNGEQKPMAISQDYTLSMGEKANLRKIVEGMLGKSMVDAEAFAFDVETLVGKPCLLTIKHKTTKKGKLVANISGTAPLMKGQKCPEQFNPSKILNYEEKWSEEEFAKLPDFIKDTMRGSLEYQTLHPVSTASDDPGF